jgi:hypothetical protein
VVGSGISVLPKLNPSKFKRSPPCEPAMVNEENWAVSITPKKSVPLAGGGANNSLIVPVLLVAVSVLLPPPKPRMVNPNALIDELKLKIRVGACFAGSGLRSSVHHIP